jgi:hypothetical protein
MSIAPMTADVEGAKSQVKASLLLGLDDLPVTYGGSTATLAGEWRISVGKALEDWVEVEHASAAQVGGGTP